MSDFRGPSAPRSPRRMVACLWCDAERGAVHDGTAPSVLCPEHHRLLLLEARAFARAERQPVPT